ncbi:5943_t:CDS:1, partial [Gigaspora rosea]
MVLLDPQDELIIDTFDFVFLLSAFFCATLFGPKKTPPINQLVIQPRVAPKKDKDFIKKMRK